MNKIQAFVQRHFATLLLLLIAAGFVTFVAELLLMHHTEGIQLVAVVASVVGLLLALAALLAPAKWRNGIAILFLLLSVTGVIGTIEHNEGDEAEGRETRLIAPTERNANQNIVYRAQDAEEGEAEEGEAEEAGEAGEAAPPPLAPLSLAGFALMGAITTLAKRDE